MLNGAVNGLRLPPGVSANSESSPYCVALSFPSETSHRGIKQPSTAFMLCSVFVLYAATATDFAIKTTYVVAHDRLINEAVATLESPSSSSIDTALVEFGQSARTASYVIGAVNAINVRRKALLLLHGGIHS